MKGKSYELRCELTYMFVIYFLTRISEKQDIRSRHFSKKKERAKEEGGDSRGTSKGMLPTYSSFFVT